MATLSDFFSKDIFGEFFNEAALKKATPIQQNSAPEALKGVNLSLISHTGSGKTLAYALPLVQNLKLREKQADFASHSNSTRAVVLAPTRELCQQVNGVFKSLAHHAKFRVRQLRSGAKLSLKGEQVDILVTNPGGLLKALKSREISLDYLEAIVFDEADQLLDMGFSKELKELQKFYKMQETQHLFVTATRPSDFDSFIAEFMGDLEIKTFDMIGDRPLQQEVETFHIQLAEREKPEMLATFLKERGRGSGIVFVNRKEQVEQVVAFLSDEKKLKRPIHSLHGGMGQRERKKKFTEFCQQKGLLVATDIAARGLDISGIEWVLNYDLPSHPVYYLHRAGRTGRPGSRGGSVINFVTSRDRELVGLINDAIREQKTLKLSPLKAPRVAGATKAKNTKKSSSSQKHHNKKKASARPKGRYKRR